MSAPSGTAVDHWSFQVDSPFRGPTEISELGARSPVSDAIAPPEPEEELFGEELASAEDEFEAYAGLEPGAEAEEFDEAAYAAAELLEEKPANEHPLAAVFSLPRMAFDAMARGGWATAIAIAVGAGNRDVNQLTNMVFWFRNPTQIGQKIRADQPHLAREWVQIRDQVVKPALAGAPGTAAPTRAVGSPPPVLGTRTSIPPDGLRWFGPPGQDTPELMAFMRKVYEFHVGRSSGSFVDTLPESAIEEVEGGKKARKDAAAAARRMLAAARADLAKQGLTGTVRIGVLSAYRSADLQFDIWQGKTTKGRGGFPHYYAETRSARRSPKFGGEHSDAAAAHLAQHMGNFVAAPGYSNHQDGLALDLGTRKGKGGLLKLYKGSWFHNWMNKHAREHHFEPLKSEAWHWIYRPPKSSSEAETWPLEAWSEAEVSPTTVPAGRMEVAKIPLLASHRGRGPDAVLRWNDMPAVPAEIDVVVHLHGYSWATMTLPKHMEVWSGLDLGPVDGAAGTGRTRPTLTVLPRGHFTGVRLGRIYRYTFPALTTRDGLSTLIREALQRFSERAGGLPPKVGRLILTAHSGGGAPLMQILRQRQHDPAEVHVFDGLYQDVTPLEEWASRHVRADRTAVQSGAAPTGAMRVFFGPSTKHFSLRLDQALAADLRDAPASLRDRYRVESSRLGHWQIARQYGWRTLADPAADVPDATRPTGAGGLVRREVDTAEVPFLPEAEPAPSAYDAAEADESDEWELEDTEGELDLEGLELEEPELDELDLEGLEQESPEFEELDLDDPELEWLEPAGEDLGDLEDEEHGPAEVAEDEYLDEGDELEDPVSAEDEADAPTNLARDTSPDVTPVLLAEAALRGELLLDPVTPTGQLTSDVLTLEHQVPPAQAPAQPPAPAPPPVATRVDVSVRTDFLVRTAAGVTFDWAHGEAVRGARAQIVGTAIQGVSDARGNLRLNTTGLPDGFHTIRIEHTVADQSSPNVAGPAVADSLATPPARIYRPLNVWVHTRGGRITLAMAALFSSHGSIGNRTHNNFDATHLPIDWKPVWMRSPMKNSEQQRATNTIDLVVVHRPNRSDIGPAINAFLSNTEVQNAHYLIDHNGHVIKLAEDRRRANHTGFSRWAGSMALNDVSIGIEVMKAPDGFSASAMGALTSLIESLRAAYPSIPARRIVGHSDIVTSDANRTLLSDRRSDPGDQFDWPVLERRGLGMVPGQQVAVGNAFGGIFAPPAPGQPAMVLRRRDRDPRGNTPARLGGVPRPGFVGTPIADLQTELERIGYSVRPVNGALGSFDSHTEAAVNKFQRHFFAGSRFNLRPRLGRVDATTAGFIRAVP